MAKTKKQVPSFHDDKMARLRDDPEYAVEYLKAALEEDETPEVFLLALRNVAEARGMSKLAQKAELHRESLYRMLSKDGNPALGNLYTILGALGLRLSIEEKV